MPPVCPPANYGTAVSAPAVCLCVLSQDLRAIFFLRIRCVAKGGSMLPKMDLIKPKPKPSPVTFGVHLGLAPQRSDIAAFVSENPCMRGDV